MRPRIAIPLPLSGHPAYVERSLPQYEWAVEAAGGEAVRIPLDQSLVEVMKIIEPCDGVLLPGSSADVDPAKYDAPKHPRTAPADPKRDTVDELLLEDAYNMRKPILGICYGLQILNVYRMGTLVQHIESIVNHEAGSKIRAAHRVVIDRQSKLAEIIEAGTKSAQPVSAVIPLENFEASSRWEERNPSRAPWVGQRLQPSAEEGEPLIIEVNSSHHQSAQLTGDGLRVVARCPEDGIIEALEGTAADHFVLGVQWHPERSVKQDASSPAIFQALVTAARDQRRRLGGQRESRR